MIRTYTELLTFPTFEQRFEYLKLPGVIGAETFGRNRYLNQAFYNSQTYREFRDSIILRDLGNDLGVEGHPIQEIKRKHSGGNLDYYGIIVHHLNPITDEDILNRAYCLTDPENVICVSHATHMAIHYGNSNGLPLYKLNKRRPGDTNLW